MLATKHGLAFCDLLIFSSDQEVDNFDVFLLKRPILGSLIDTRRHVADAQSRGITGPGSSESTRMVRGPKTTDVCAALVRCKIDTGRGEAYRILKILSEPTQTPWTRLPVSEGVLRNLRSERRRHHDNSLSTLTVESVDALAKSTTPARFHSTELNMHTLCHS